MFPIILRKVYRNPAIKSHGFIYQKVHGCFKNHHHQKDHHGTLRKYQWGISERKTKKAKIIT